MRFTVYTKACANPRRGDLSLGVLVMFYHFQYILFMNMFKKGLCQRIATLAAEISHWKGKVKLFRRSNTQSFSERDLLS